MKREIKFRAWEKDHMIYSDMIPDNNEAYHNYTSVFVCQNGYCHLFEDNGDGNDIVYSLSEDAIGMQFTGLKDKNGKEIYEVDIFNLDTDRPVAIIEYDYCGFVFKWIDGIFKTVRRLKKEPIFKNVHLFEVIGNIYENPELLKENEGKNN